MKLRPLAIVIVGITLVAVGVYYWPSWQPTQQSFKRKGGGKRNANANGEVVPVLAVEARRADVPVYLNGVGTARALNMVTVKPQVDGKLISISFTEGQDVPKGYVLAKIDPTIYQAQYDQAVATKAFREAQLLNARLDLERYERLAKTNAINKQQLDTQRALVAQLEAQVRGDQAAIDNARAILSYTDITAPIAGRTGIRQVDVGNIVHQSDSTGLVVITQIKPISVLFSLPQQNLPALNRGMAEGPLPVDAMSPDGRKPIDSGKVLVIDNQVDPATGTVRLKAEFQNHDLQLWPGQFVNVRLLIDTRRQVVVVPTAAVQRGPRGTFVFVIKEDNTVTVRPVTVAQQDDQTAVIGSGLEAGERVVTTGFARLAEGTRVEPSRPNAPGEAKAKRPAGGKGKRGGKRKSNGQTGSNTSAPHPKLQTQGTGQQGPGARGAAMGAQEAGQQNGGAQNSGAAPGQAP